MSPIQKMSAVLLLGPRFFLIKMKLPHFLAVSFLALFMCVSHAPGQTYQSVCPISPGKGSLSAAWERSCSPLPCALRRGPAGHGDTHTRWSGCISSPFYESGLFQSVHCVLNPLVTPSLWRCSELRSVGSYSWGRALLPSLLPFMCWGSSAGIAS